MKSAETVLISILCLASAVFAEKTTLKLATTTSTYETGLLDKILPPFEKNNGVKVHVISVGTGKAIKLGENGDVDLILVHARNAEDKFVREGFGINRQDVMYNDFLIIGPTNDPAGISGYKDASKALARIAEENAGFVSRGDNSGTHLKEMSLWKKNNISPEGKWYMESGQGMSATVRMADEKNAYLLVDRGTYIAQKRTLQLTAMVEGDPLLTNPYGVIAVNPVRHKHVNAKKAEALINWLVSAKCQNMIAAFRKNGELLFHPSAAIDSKK